VKVLLTGAAGFIGFHTAKKLLARGDEVVGLDNLNDYYDPNLKRARLSILQKEPKFRFVKMDLADKGGMKSLFAREKFPRVIHLAAQAGVRYSLENPQAYIDSNVTGTLNLLQAAGLRRPIKSERAVGTLFGSGVGVLYSVTTISGPPLAVMLSNQGFTKGNFRTALGFIRLAESSFTAVAYFYAGLFTMQSAALMPFILPSIMVGVPIGGWLIRQIRPETFRRICMSFDAWVVAFGLSNLLKELHLVQSNLAFLFMFAVGAIDAVLLYYFFTVQLPRVKREADEAAVVTQSASDFMPALAKTSAQRT